MDFWDVKLEHGARLESEKKGSRLAEWFLESRVGRSKSSRKAGIEGTRLNCQ